MARTFAFDLSLPRYCALVIKIPSSVSEGNWMRLEKTSITIFIPIEFFLKKAWTSLKNEPFYRLHVAYRLIPVDISLFFYQDECQSWRRLIVHCLLLILQHISMCCLSGDCICIVWEMHCTLLLIGRMKWAKDNSRAQLSLPTNLRCLS